MDNQCVLGCQWFCRAFQSQEKGHSWCYADTLPCKPIILLFSIKVVDVGDRLRVSSNADIGEWRSSEVLRFSRINQYVPVSHFSGLPPMESLGQRFTWVSSTPICHLPIVGNTYGLVIALERTESNQWKQASLFPSAYRRWSQRCFLVRSILTSLRRRDSSVNLIGSSSYAQGTSEIFHWLFTSLHFKLPLQLSTRLWKCARFDLHLHLNSFALGWLVPQRSLKQQQPHRRSKMLIRFTTMHRHTI